MRLLVVLAAVVAGALVIRSRTAAEVWHSADLEVDQAADQPA